ncbi:MAG TPA: hypothetical protein VIV58_14490, partial [Kofleriaceae bacterium]
MRWQPYVGSVAIHALLIAVALRAGVAPQDEDPAPQQPAVELIDVSMTPPAAADDDDSGGGGGGARASMALPDVSSPDRVPAPQAADAPER